MAGQAMVIGHATTSNVFQLGFTDRSILPPAPAAPEIPETMDGVTPASIVPIATAVDVDSPAANLEKFVFDPTVTNESTPPG